MRQFIALTLSLIFSLILLFTGEVSIGEALFMFAAGTCAPTHLFVCKP